jgi:hypothetical protein
MHGRVLLGALASALLLAAPASAAVPGGNLVANPGAEAGAGAADSSTQLPLPGWTVESTLTAVKYGAPAFLTTEDGSRLDGGANFFSGGPGSETSAASQTVDVSAAAAEIDAGSLSMSLSALIGGYASQDDAATVTATPLTSSSIAIGSATTIGPVTSTDRKSTTDLLRRSATFAVPAGTRKISVRITATRAAGSYNDGYVDNVNLSFGGSPAAGKSVVAGVLSGKVLVRLAGSSKFVALDPSVIKNGAEFDTRKGVVEITRADGGVAKFYAGIFKLSQSGGITTMTLSQKLTGCRKGKASAVAAAKKPKTRKLWGDGKGKFRTRGQYSAATIRGTKWLVQDRCTSTLTRVTKGVVAVQDRVKKKTVVVRKGKRYTARARR